MAYITVEDVADALNLDPDDETRDIPIAMAIAAAEKMIDEHCGRSFSLAVTASARVYPGDGSDELIIDDIGSGSDLLIEVGYRGSSVWTSVTDYELTPLNAFAKGRPVNCLERQCSWGDRNTRVRVTAKWGWPSVPDNVKQAALIQATRLFKRKDSPEGVLGSAEFGLVRVSRVDPDVQALLAPYVLPGF